MDIFIIGIRFHILCGYLLCEENVPVFDRKMNNDAVLGYLQSLRQYYMDLSCKVIHFSSMPLKSMTFHC